LSACISREDVFDLISARPWDGPFELLDVYATSDTSVRAVFSRYVDEASASEASHYSIPGLTIISSRIDSSDRTSVDLTTFPQQNIQYGLTVQGVVDVDGYALEKQNTLYFHGDVAPSVVSVSSYSNTQVVVYFSEEVEQVSAEDVANYSITPALNVVSATRDTWNEFEAALFVEADSPLVVLVDHKNKPFGTAVEVARPVMGESLGLRQQMRHDLPRVPPLRVRGLAVEASIDTKHRDEHDCGSFATGRRPPPGGRAE
jgi:hypothetical protein